MIYNPCALCKQSFSILHFQLRSRRLCDKSQAAGKYERTVNFEGGIYKNTLSGLRNLTGMV